MSSILEMPLSQISTSRRFLSRLSSTIFFKDLDILAGKGADLIRPLEKQVLDLSRKAKTNESQPFGV